MNRSVSKSQTLLPIGELSHTHVYCPRPQCEQIADLLLDLPLHVPNRPLHLELSGRSLVISSPEGLEDTAIQCTAHGATTTVTRTALRIKLSHRGIHELEFIYSPRELPSSETTSLAEAHQPIELLDEYVRLKSRGTLNREEQSRLQALPDLIGKEFREREERLRLARSSRSTPESYGESRSGFSGRGPG